MVLRDASALKIRKRIHIWKRQVAWGGHSTLDMRHGLFFCARGPAACGAPPQCHQTPHSPTQTTAKPQPPPKLTPKRGLVFWHPPPNLSIPPRALLERRGEGGRGSRGGGEGVQGREGGGPAPPPLAGINHSNQELQK